MSAAASGWSSAIAPGPPPIPRGWHWATGIALAVLALAAISLRYAEGEAPMIVEEDEAVLVSLGGAARRLEAPPPEVETSANAPEVAERAEDAPPPSAPAQPRVVAGASDGDGRASSGTGGAGSGPVAPLPPPRAQPPAPPPRPRPAQVSRQFMEVSTLAYNSQIVYPRASLDNEEQGRGVLRVTVAHDGRVLDWKITRSTGHNRLDLEIQRVARMVNRLDPLPSDFDRDQAVVDIPIVFTIEYFD